MGSKLILELALSLQAQYNVDKAILSRPISTLAKMKGLHAEQVYDRLIPELAKTNEAEVMRYAETGLRYASIVDKNRLREELGPKFIIAMDMIINIVRSGLDSSEPWVKRKAMMMHGELIDEEAEKRRFLDTIMTEQRMQMLKDSKEQINVLEAEIISFEEPKFYPPMVVQ